MKSNDWIAFSGMLGVTLLCIMMEANEQQRILCHLLILINQLCAYQFTSEQLDTLEADVVETVAKCEFLLPVWFCSHALHTIIHIPESIRRWGCIQQHWMFPDEVRR